MNFIRFSTDHLYVTFQSLIDKIVSTAHVLYLIDERYKIFLCWLIKKKILTSHEALKETKMFLLVRNGKKYLNAIYISSPLWDFSSVAIQNTY